MIGLGGMGDHLTLDVDRLIAGAAVSSSQDSDSTTEAPQSAVLPEHTVTCTSVTSRPSLPPSQNGYAAIAVDEVVGTTDAVPHSETSAIVVAECRICQEEDDVKNLDTPCACSGSVKFAHRKCVQRWCNEKGDTTCEICHQPYKNGYNAPTRPPHADGIPIELSGDWGLTTGHQFDLRDPRLLAMAAAERHLLDAEYDEYAAANASGAACCRSAALILMALLLLRHALAMSPTGQDADSSTFFALFLLRAAGFLLPCYIMARAMNILQRRRQRQEAAIAAAEVAILLQAGQARAVHFTVASAPTSEP